MQEDENKEARASIREATLVGKILDEILVQNRNLINIIEYFARSNTLQSDRYDTDKSELTGRELSLVGCGISDRIVTDCVTDSTNQQQELSPSQESVKA